MSLATPILQSQKSFDKNLGTTFLFNVVGGDVVTKNKLTIKKNSDNTIVYEETQNTILYKHLLSTSTNLVNGNVYNAYINTYNSSGDISDNSNIIQFTCYTTPTLTIDNLPSNDVIATSNFNFNVVYNQIEFELLDSVIFKLYDEDDNLLLSSAKLYNYNNPPCNISYLIGGFEDLTNYKVQVEGTSVNQVSFKSAVYSFFVSYDSSILNSSISLTNNCNLGRIDIYVENTLSTSSNISDISAIKIKRRLENTYNWVDIYIKQVTSQDDLTFTISDTFAPLNDSAYEYAIVPVLASGVETNYTTESIVSQFNGVFISDTQNSYKLISNVGIQRPTITSQGVLEPIGGKYPFIVFNSKTNYEKGTVNGTLLGNFENTRAVNRYEISKYTTDFIKFLTNGEIKVVKDWNGNICVCAIVGDITCDNDLITGLSNISFQYIEQGKYDNQEDLYMLDLVKGD